MPGGNSESEIIAAQRIADVPLLLFEHVGWQQQRARDVL